ncbi:hypothetical protein, partial [Gottfriedia acidiceleris]|uniref:hypothetical protein n=1 Tax=Gottfriedia acidiceleris TaxID=371036 RepID=UPI003000B0F7
MSIIVKPINLNEIDYPYPQNISEKEITYWIRSILKGKDYHYLIEVERKRNRYLLISGANVFEALKRLTKKNAICRVIEHIDDDQTLLNLLLESFLSNKGRVINRYKIVRELHAKGYTSKDIAKKIGFSYSDINKYSLENVPFE